MEGSFLVCWYNDNSLRIYGNIDQAVRDDKTEIDVQTLPNKTY